MTASSTRIWQRLPLWPGRGGLCRGQRAQCARFQEVDFLPLRYEQYDLIVPISELGRPVVQRVLEVLRSDALRMENRGAGRL